MTSIRSFFATYERDLLIFVDWLLENGFALTRDLHQLTREERFSIYKVVSPPMQYSLQLRLERLLMLDRGAGAPGMVSRCTQTNFKKRASRHPSDMRSKSTQCNPYSHEVKPTPALGLPAEVCNSTGPLVQDDVAESDHHTDSVDDDPPCGAQSAFSRPTKRARTSMGTNSSEPNMATQQRHPCPACPLSFLRKDSLTVHYRSHTGVNPFVCRSPGCDEAFRSRKALARHRNAHLLEKNFPCDICGRKFKTLACMKKHRKVHVEKKEFECEICHRCFRRKDNLQVHRLTHSDEKNYACSLCGKRFRQRSGLAFHARSHEVQRPYKCGACGRAFAHRIALAKHSASVHEQY
jgi:uncharacterized Zn-finger protein